MVLAFLADELVNRHGTFILSDLKTRDNQKEVREKSCGPKSNIESNQYARDVSGQMGWRSLKSNSGSGFRNNFGYDFGEEEFLFDSDRLDLDLNIFREPCHLYRGPCRIRRFKEFSVHRIHLAKIIHILKEN